MNNMLTRLGWHDVEDFALCQMKDQRGVWYVGKMILTEQDFMTTRIKTKLRHWMRILLSAASLKTGCINGSRGEGMRADI